MSFERIAVLGCGLIGGSFALAMKEKGFAGEIVGWDQPEVLEQAQACGALDRTEKALVSAVAGADLIYVATPVVTILTLLPEVGAAAKAGALVTDAGSTKERICRMAQEVLPESVYFLGGHPIAGKESSGIENADANLFSNAKYVVVQQTRETGGGGVNRVNGSERPIDEFLRWVVKLGAEPIALDAETHDWAMAFVSHLPQLLSTALASTVDDETDDDGLPLQLAAGGFRDMVRLAGSPYDVWRDICLTNRGNIRRALERLEKRLEQIRLLLDSKELAEEFRKAQQVTQQMKTERSDDG